MPDRSIWTDTETVKFVQPNAYILHNQESFADVEEVCNFARQMATTATFVTDKEAAKIKQQLNACIRAGEEVNPDDFDCDINLLRLWALVKSIKDDCLHICRNDGPAAYINGNRIDAEGYVMTNEFGMFKLVNRECFSYHNFNSGRFQCAS
jgi:signal transduction histidine kinase